jgi:hypothetical protein
MQSEASHIELTNPTPCVVCEPFERVTLQCLANTAHMHHYCDIHDFHLHYLNHRRLQSHLQTLVSVPYFKIIYIQGVERPSGAFA